MDDKVKLDTRLVERLIARGDLKPEEYEKHLKDLTDTTPAAENVEAALAERAAFGLPVAAPAPAAKKGKGAK